VTDSRPESDVGSLPEPWLRLPAKRGKAGTTESAKAYAAFQLYYTASPNQRSLRQTGLKLGKSETLLEGWSSRFYWVWRAEAWDRHQAQIIAAECEQRRREEAAGWARREREVIEQDYAAGRVLVERGLQIITLPLTERTIQKRDTSGNQTTIIKPANRGQTGVAAMIKVGHYLSLDCVKRSRPEPSTGSIVDDYDFVPLTDKADEGEGG